VWQLPYLRRSGLLAIWLASFCSLSRAQAPESAKPAEWKSVSFAIVRYNDEAPQSWNIYHTSKRGVLLVKLWKRYLLVKIPEEQVFVQWSASDTPNEAIEIADWKQRNVGPVQRVRFRLGKNGHMLELQLPLRTDGKPAY
jgi:hypothetical protein